MFRTYVYIYKKHLGVNNCRHNVTHFEFSSCVVDNIMFFILHNGIINVFFIFSFFFSSITQCITPNNEWQ